MNRLASFVTGRPRLILGLAALWVATCIALGGDVTERLSTGGQEVPGAQSTAVSELLRSRGQVPPNLVVEISQDGGLGDSARAMTETAAAVIDADPNASVVGSWGQGSGTPDPLVGSDDTTGLLLASIGGDTVALQQTAADLAERLRSLDVPDGLRLAVGGEAAARADLIETTDSDLLRAELLVLPFAILILLAVFRSPLAAATPLVVVAFALPSTIGALRLLTEFTEVSVFARSVSSVLGLAMAIDMSLFFVAAYREHRPQAENDADAVRSALGSVGPSILVSGLTTAIALAGLLVFEPPLLRSFAYAGSMVVLSAIVGGLVVLPAAMMLAGPHLDRWSLPRRRARASGFWAGATAWVFRFRYPVSAAVILLLVVAASPVTRLDVGLNDDRVLPPSVESRSVLDHVRSDYPMIATSTIPVLDPTATDVDLNALATTISDRTDVQAAVVADPSIGLIAVTPAVEPVSVAGRALVEELRTLPDAPNLLVGGQAGRLVDNANHIQNRLWLVVALMVGASGLLIGALSGSLLVPLKAVALNMLSLMVMFGAIVWIFQDGRFAGLLGYSPTGLTDLTVPVLMFCVAFGLSMDYEIYLMARIRREFNEVPDLQRAVARGLDRTASVVSASALLMIVTFAAFATASVTHLKILGIGLALAIAVDAFLIRLLLVPAFLAMAGRWNFWPSVRTPPSQLAPQIAPQT